MINNLFQLAGKVTLITGGNGGLGLGFARGIAKHGGDLEIWGRCADKNAAAKSELENYGVQVTARQVDVASQEQVREGYRALIADHGRIDCVIANSGVNAATRSILNTSAEEYHSLLDINMHGAFYTLQEGAKLMVERCEAGEPGGSLVFCGSLAMFRGVPGKAQYAAAKAGMGAAIKCMAVELGKYGIRANCIAPGYVKTAMTGDSEEWNEFDRMIAAKTPIARPGRPSDYEGIATYLASDASRWHSGDTIVIDGGSLINP